jgi:AraC-like DNA-binding protein
VRDGEPRYLERAPTPALAEWIECYWSIRGQATSPIPNRVLPDGCSDVILGIEGMEPAVVGTMRTATMYPVRGPVDMFGVRFRPGGAARFLGVPLWELTDRRIALDELWGGEAAALADAAEPVTMDERIARAERVLLARLRTWAARRTAAEELAARAVTLLRRARGGVGVREVAAALGVGERRLERAFDHAVGMGPKALAGVLRFRRLVRAIDAARQRGPVAWAALAVDAGYADQPHLAREFKRLAGLTPAQYEAERAGVGFVQDPGAAPS